MALYSSRDIVHCWSQCQYERSGRRDAAIEGCSIWARGDGEAAAREGRRPRLERLRIWLDAVVVGRTIQERGGDQAVAREGR